MPELVSMHLYSQFAAHLLEELVYRTPGHWEKLPLRNYPVPEFRAGNIVEICLLEDWMQGNGADCVLPLLLERPQCDAARIEIDAPDPQRKNFRDPSSRITGSSYQHPNSSLPASY